VIFEFHQKNHSAVQSSFADPCGQKPGGFNSGFHPVAANVTSDFPTFMYTVQTTAPVWVYCAQGDGLHCHSGMVFAINCPASGTNSFANFKAAAIAQGANASSSAYAPAAASTTAATDVAAPDTTSYPGITVPPPDAGTLVTSTISVDSSTWTTTYTSYAGSPNPTPNSLAGNVIDVMVGANGSLTYDPPFVTANPRDTIVFHFNPKNHTVVQSSFADPCRKLEFTNPNVTDSIDSGFMPVPQGATTSPQFSVVVNDTVPLWFYCKQANHCGMGMVFAVNPVQTGPRNFSAFQALAMQINGTAAPAAGGSAAAPGTGAASRVSASAALALVSIALGAVLL